MVLRIELASDCAEHCQPSAQISGIHFHVKTTGVLSSLNAAREREEGR